MKATAMTLSLLLAGSLARIEAQAQSKPGPDEYRPAEPGLEDLVRRDVEGHVTLGFGTSFEDGDFEQASGLSGGRAGEYADDGSSPYLDGRLRWNGESALLRAAGAFRSKDEASAGVFLDVARRFVLRGDFTRFTHRGDHDPMVNNAMERPDEILRRIGFFDDPTNPKKNPNGFNPAEVAVEFFDVDSERIAIIRRMLTDLDARFHVVPGVELTAGVRLEKRKGSRFARTLDNAHQSTPLDGTEPRCFTCHVNQEHQDIDQLTTDLRLGLLVSRSKFSLEAEYLHRTFDDSSEPMSLNYGNPDRVDPAKIGVDEFAIRRPHAFDSRNEFASTPDSEKDALQLRVRFDASDQHSVAAHGGIAQYHNKKLDAPTTFGYYIDRNPAPLDPNHSDNARYASVAFGFMESNLGRGKVDLTTGGGSYTGTFLGGKLRLDLRGRYEDYDSEIDSFTAATPSLAGVAFDTQIGNMDRRTVSFKGTASSPLAGRKLTLRGTGEYVNRERDGWFVPKTRTWRAGGELEFRPNRKFSAYARYRHEDVDQPFANPADADKRLLRDPDHPQVANEQDLLFAFGATNQILQTKLPSATDVVKVGFKVQPTLRFGLQGTLHAAVAENPDVGLDSDVVTGNATLWLTPGAGTSLTASYTYQNADLTTDLLFGDAISLIPTLFEDSPTTPNTRVPGFINDPQTGLRKLPFLIGENGFAVLDILRARGVGYESTSHDVSVGFRTQAGGRVKLTGGLHYGRHEQGFEIGTEAELVDGPFQRLDQKRDCDDTLSKCRLAPGLGRFSATDIRQLGASLGIEFLIRKPISAYVQGRIEDYQDDSEEEPLIARGSNRFTLVYGGVRIGF